MSSRQLISQLKSSKDGYTDETMLISLERKWNGQFQTLIRAKFRKEAKGVAKHLAACLCKDHKEEVLKMFSVEHNELAKPTN